MLLKARSLGAKLLGDAARQLLHGPADGTVARLGSVLVELSLWRDACNDGTRSCAVREVISIEDSRCWEPGWVRCWRDKGVIERPQAEPCYTDVTGEGRRRTTGTQV